MLNDIDGAENRINMAAYSFTHKPVVAALVGAKNRGVTKRVIVILRLSSLNAIVHNKFMGVDDNTVQTSSFHYTSSAKKLMPKCADYQR